MDTSDIDNPKLGIESPGSGEHSENISLFGKKIEKKVQTWFKHFFLLFGVDFWPIFLTEKIGRK